MAINNQSQWTSRLIYGLLSIFPAYIKKQLPARKNVFIENAKKKF